MLNCGRPGCLLRLRLQLIKLGTVCQHHRWQWHRHPEHFHPAGQWKLYPEGSGGCGDGSLWGLVLFNFCDFVRCRQGRECWEMQLQHEVWRRASSFHYVHSFMGISAVVCCSARCVSVMIRRVHSKYTILQFVFIFKNMKYFQVWRTTSEESCSLFTTSKIG